MPEPSPDLRVLGQLLLVQSTLQVMPQASGVGDLVCRGLSVFPGVEAVGVCLGGRLTGRSAGFPDEHALGAPLEACSGDGNCTLSVGKPMSCLRLQTVNKGYGCLVFLLDAPGRLATYEPHLRNTANVLAMTLENREQEARLRELNEDLRGQVAGKERAEAALLETQRGLERAVGERTLALASLNQALAAEVRERRQAQDASAREAALNGAVAELAQAMLATSQIGEISSIVLERARRLTESPIGYVGYIEPEAGHLVCPAITGEAWPSAPMGPNGVVFEHSAGLRGWVLTHREPLLTNTASDDARSSGVPEGHLPIRRFLSAPAVAGGEVVGQISLANAARDYTEKDLALLQRLAEVYALAVQRERQAEERRHLSEQIERAQRLQAVGVLAGGVAHDFRNLLQIIQGQVDLLLASADEAAPAAEALREVARSTHRAAEITQQLLAFSRKSGSETQRVDLNQVVRAVVRMLEHTLPKMIRVELCLSDDLGTVDVDPGQMEQVLLNLAVNARDAMPEGGVLRVVTTGTTLEEEAPVARADLAPGDYVALRVSDTGHGMTPETVRRIFDPFFTTKPVGQGTGLGLSVAYGIVKGHGGQIGCDSTPGRGSTFTVLLPLLQESASPAAVAGPSAPRGRVASGTILVVDDEPSILGAMEAVLEDAGYRTHRATSGEEAIALFARLHQDIDAVVLDLGMPGMGGAACLREILRLDPGARVIVSTGYAPAGGAEAGAAAFLIKPYRLPVLLETVQGVLDVSARNGSPISEG